jgi:hypothetical protein
MYAPRLKPLPIVLSLPLWVSACVQPRGRGPDMGACSEPPDGVYAFGEVGIGSCLAGPADLKFVRVQGQDLLAITNADPFRNFRSGSVVLLDPSRLDPEIDATPSIDTLAVGALDLPPFASRIGWDAAREQLVIPSRESADALTTSTADPVWFVDVSDPTAPALRTDAPFLTTRQDPFDVQILGDRAYVVSPSDVSIAVVELDGVPRLFDPDPTSLVTPPLFDDVDGSGSRAELVATVIDGREITVEDAWTASRVDGTLRAWLPEGPDLARWSSGGGGPAPWTPAAFGAEVMASDLGLPSLRDPWITDNGVSLGMTVASGNQVWATGTDGSAGLWIASASPVLTTSAPWSAALGGTAVVGLGERVVLYYDGQSTVDDGEAGTSIGYALTSDGVTFLPAADPVLTPSDPAHGLAQPSIFLDPLSDDVRMWVSHWDGARWSIALASSDDGLSGWSEPVDVVSDAGAPWVVWRGGRYTMLAAFAYEGSWWFGTSESPDGRRWSPPVRFYDTEEPVGAARPPRAAVQLVPDAGWRVEGLNRGLLGEPVRDATPSAEPTVGFQLAFASGAQVGLAAIGAADALGFEPGSAVEVLGATTVVGTVWGPDGTPSIGAFRPALGGWRQVQADLWPLGSAGNAGGAESPVLAPQGSGWVLYAGVRDAAGVAQLATADVDVDVGNGEWRVTPRASSAMAAPPTMASEGLIPHAVAGDALWYSGYDGSRWQIGRATTSDGGVTWTPDPGVEGDGVLLAPGDPGAWDDSGVRDPVPFECGRRGLMYAGFDGSNWAIGVAWDDLAGGWERRREPFSGAETALLGGIPDTFAAAGVRSPVALAAAGVQAACGAWMFSGIDGTTWRGALAWLHEDGFFPELALPTVGDRFVFDSLRGEPGTSVIDLGQTVDGVALPGSVASLATDGPAASVWDDGRGLLYLVSKIYPGVIAVDLRDDSTPGAPDRNYLNIETVLRVQSTTGQLGFQDVWLDTARDRLFLTAREPDAVVVVDLQGVVDDDRAEILDETAIGAIALRDLTDDAGEQTYAGIGGAGMAYVPGLDLLLVTHFRANAVSVIDLSLGAFGAEVAWIDHVGENPHVVRVTPDGRYAVVGNYLGEVRAADVGSSLAWIDLDPTSPRFLEVVATVGNR